ncbi:MAG: SDR family oxidoreductase [Planctomycetota bacterium]|nr:SDR family oxidoreductase [Planctomycetota bacterium]
MTADPYRGYGLKPRRPAASGSFGQSPRKGHLMQLAGKRALVTGAGRGIGRAIAVAYAKAGADVAVLSRTTAEIDHAAEEIRQTGRRSVALTCDVTDFQQVAAAIQQVGQQLGGLEILVNNAGDGQERTNVGEDDPQRWVHVVEVNLIGTYYVSRAALPLLKQNGGTIINVSSGMAHQPRSGNSSYNTSKAAVWMFTRCLASEVWQDKVTVNELIPGPVYTELTQSLWAPDQPHPTIASEWIKRPHDVAPLALFLASQSGPGPTAQSFSLARRPL